MDICNNIKTKFYDIIREHLKKKITSNFGKIIEDQEKIICYVKRFRKLGNSYLIDTDKYSRYMNEKLLKDYDLDKPIYYVIDNIKFQKYMLYIFSYNDSNIIIRNCECKNLVIRTNGNCVIENTTILASRLISINSNELVIKDVNIADAINKLNINIDVNKKVNVTNFNVDRKNFVNNDSSFDLINFETSHDKIDLSINDIFNSNFITNHSNKKRYIVKKL